MRAFGFLRLRSSKRQVEPLSSNKRAVAKLMNGEVSDPARVLQTLAPAEGVAVFLASHNQLITSATNTTWAVLIAGLLGLVVSVVITFLGVTDPSAKQKFQWSVFCLRLIAYFLFVVMLSKSCGVEFMPYQELLGPLSIIVFSSIAPAIIKRLEGKPNTGVNQR